MSATITVLVGTKKGAFLLESDAARKSWSLRGPFCGGWPINHVIGDPESGMIWAAGGDEFPGAGVWRSDDGGATWVLSKLANGKFDAWLREDPAMAKELGVEPDPPAPFTGAIDALWSLGFSGGRLYTGAKPAQLYVSADAGETWEKLQGLNDHPSADSWEPGGAGLVLHSIVHHPGDPRKLWVGISAAGVFATEDGGTTWDRRNRRSNADAASHGDDGHGHGAEVGYCVHNIVRAAGDGDTMYQQNHHGVFRSSDGGRSWLEISDGLPSTFGFPVASNPGDPQMLWVLPLNGDMAGRYPPDASAAVWKSSDGGASWARKDEGLPNRDCFFTVLRQAMATDREDRTGVYFGTTTGSVFASSDEGESWIEIARHLPSVLSVETLSR